MNLPEDYLKRIKGQLGDRYEDFIRCMDQPPFKALRLNRQKIAQEDFLRFARMATLCSHPRKVAGLTGAYYYEDALPGKNPLHDTGAYYIQEPSAMIPAGLLDAHEGSLKVLDLCASPGGKTTQIADCMNDTGLLVANEIIPSRALTLSGNIERMGITNTLVTCADPKDLAGRFGRFFDRILVDAPCSGEGMFRKNPEAVFEWSKENVKKCAARQDMILDCASRMLAPGGKIVYSTCTFSPDEDEGTLDRFLKSHPAFTVCDGPYRIWPHEGAGEGHFAAVLTAAGDDAGAAENEAGGNSLSKKKKGRASSPKPSYPADLLDDFLSRTLKDTCPVRILAAGGSDRIISFRDSIYLAPEHMPDISGLTVLRAGLKLGTFKKDRFEPDHALSHALHPADISFFIDMGYEDIRVKDYLAGMTIGCDKEEKGWCLVCTEGLSLGWGKASGGIIKNHYPRGLRR